MAGPSPNPARSAVAHLVRRVGFGATAEEIDELADLGYAAAVETVCDLRLNDPAADAVPEPVFGGADADRGAENQALIGWWLQRMVVADRPVREKLTFLWHDHFATSLRKVDRGQLLHRQWRTLFELGPGRFETLLGAVLRDPAMLVWLDGIQNRAGAPNENLARELLELFTLGHGGHAGPPYTESDVAETARALTGWTIDRDTLQTTFVPRRFDSGVKTVLGVTGPLGLDEIVAIVTDHPAFAPHVVAVLWSKLARPAGSDDPVVRELAPGFARTQDVGALLRAIVLHPEFLAPASRSGLVKTPVELLVGALRALRLPLDGRLVRATLPALGQIPFLPPDVSGWPANEAWLSTATAMTRVRMARALAEVADVSALDQADLPQRAGVAARLLGVERWGRTTLSALHQTMKEPRLLLATALASPEHLLA